MPSDIQESKQSWNQGPDKIISTDSEFVSKLNQACKIRLDDLDSKIVPPLSIYTMFKRTVDQKPNHDALVFKNNPNGEWIRFSMLEYWRICRKAAKSFIKIGLGESEVVCIVGFNSPQWFVSMLGAIFAGGVGCGIYTTNTSEACEYILKDSKSQIVVVENQQQLDKILKCKDKLPLKKIIQYSGTVENNHGGLVISWSDFIDHGNDIDELILELRIKTIAPNKCASLIYTSGTTGDPKAAMISHDNITYVVRYLGGELVNLRRFRESFVSYLPLSHIAAQAIDLFAPLYHGITIYFAQPDALKGSLNKTMKEVRPTYFFGVPRVWEKFQENIEKVTKNLTGTKLSIYLWARKVSREHIMAKFSGRQEGQVSFKIAKAIILNKILKELGLDRCNYFYSGAAPITKETLEFFYGLGISLCEVYGMSETTGPHCVGTGFKNKPCSVGPVTPCNKSKLGEKDADGSGELLINGRHVFMGYLNDEKKTKEVFDPESFIRTGDIAKIENGYIYITGRLKELIITAGGENIAPVPVEDNVKMELPNLISNCMLVGDKKKYLVILVTLKCKMNMNTMEPLDELTDECIKWLASIGSKAKTVSEVIENNDKKVYKAIEDGIKRANEKSVSRAARVQKFAILPRDFSLANGELGPTLKLRRPIVNKMYASVIEDLYKDSGAQAD